MAEQTNGEHVPMFKVSDPVTTQQIDLDELFNDIYYLEQKGIPDPTPVSSNSEAMVAPPADTDNQKKRSAEAAGINTTMTAAAASSSEPENTTATMTDNINAALPDEAESANTKDLTEQQKIERRERNREHAKRSRLRKKFLLESLQGQINELEEQVSGLKNALKQELPAHRAEHVIASICGDKEKYTPLPMPSGFGPVKTLMEPDFRLMSALSGSQQNFAISDPTLPDNPIVYCSQGFLDLTGYTLDQVLGRNCRFLQGPGTDQSAVQVIRKGIAEGVDTSVCLLNYKADGTPFWNQFFVAALRDAQNNVVNYVGVQCEVSKAVVEKHMPAPAPMKKVT
mmetsp:Transcript_23537/g.65485  ORF Transcript_23537/g.65485 Transcript_23537/m.65485 type:complete len:340 (+) Transcript_23537:146-1165(+)|eukprot:CAMPEP_0168737854 /NCGR_PEP_ID=MMETSP0724-20121128/10617_1 /TAXON_ID=265536 /ORGANISM="Amphiprora sp., Strain CCMP467" /LENGTH=339 /DNA_ID=CAMNT_0008785149 /DNA_START=51 /DNA_END=1070 /DNA_ORIENTATION=+